MQTPFPSIQERTNCVVDYYTLTSCIINFDRYVIIQELAIDKGATAVVFKVYNRETRGNTVVKIQAVADVENAINETAIGCLLSNFPGFVNLINFWVCDTTPKNWKFTKSQSKQEAFFWHSQLHFYLEMEEYEGDLETLLIDNRNSIGVEDKLSIWKELIYALLQAYNMYKFAHNDIKLPNIFYKFVNSPRKYVMEGKVLRCNSIYYPVWGDFGLSKIGNESSQRDDVIFIGNMMTIHKHGLNLPEPYKQKVEDLYVYDQIKSEIIGIEPGFSYVKLLDILN